MLENAVKALKSLCETHQRTLESHRKQIVGFQWEQGSLDSTYQGEEFELMELVE